MKKNGFIWLVIVLLLSSCIKDTIDDLTAIKGIKTNPTLAVPIINSQLGIDKFVKDASGRGIIIDVDPDKRIVLKMFGSDSIEQKQFIGFPPVYFETDFSMPAPAIPIFEASGNFSATVNEETAITTNNNEQIERVHIKQGRIITNVSSEFKHDVIITVTYPGITKNGVPLVDTYNFPSTGSNQPVVRSIDIGGYLMDLTKNGTTTNIVSYEVKADITRNPDNNVQPSDKIVFQEAIDIKEYQRADGYFGKIEVLDFEQTQTISLFDKKLDGNVYLHDPILRLSVDNSIGMPIVGYITDVYVESGNGNVIPVSIDPFKDTFSLDYTTITGQTRKTEYIIDRHNSNIDEVLSSAPQKIHFLVSFIANAGNQVTENVITDKSTIKVTSTLELPLDLRILNYVLQETGQFDVGDPIGDSNNLTLDWAELISDVENNIPLNAHLQVYFEDSVTNIIQDSLFDTELLIPAAKVNSLGEAIGPGKEYATTRITRERYNRIMKGNRYSIKIRLRTAEENGNYPSVTFYIDQKIRLKMGLKTKLTYQSN